MLNEIQILREGTVILEEFNESEIITVNTEDKQGITWFKVVKTHDSVTRVKVGDIVLVESATKLKLGSTVYAMTLQTHIVLRREV